MKSPTSNPGARRTPTGTPVAVSGTSSDVIVTFTPPPNQRRLFFVFTDRGRAVAGPPALQHTSVCEDRSVFHPSMPGHQSDSGRQAGRGGSNPVRQQPERVPRQPAFMGVNVRVNRHFALSTRSLSQPCEARGAPLHPYPVDRPRALDGSGDAATSDYEARRSSRPKHVYGPRGLEIWGNRRIPPGLELDSRRRQRGRAGHG